MEPNAATNVQRPNTFWGIYLVCRYRQQVAADLLDVGLDLARGLNGVGVEPYLASRFSKIVNQLRYLRDRLDRADLVVREHYRNKYGFLFDRGFYILDSDDPVLVNGKI